MPQERLHDGPNNDGVVVDFHTLWIELALKHKREVLDALLLGVCLADGSPSQDGERSCNGRVSRNMLREFKVSLSA